MTQSVTGMTAHGPRHTCAAPASLGTDIWRHSPARPGTAGQEGEEARAEACGLWLAGSASGRAERQDLGSRWGREGPRSVRTLGGGGQVRARSPRVQRPPRGDLGCRLLHACLRDRGS